MPKVTTTQLVILAGVFIVAVVALTFVFGAVFDNVGLGIPVALIIGAAITYAAWLGVRSTK